MFNFEFNLDLICQKVFIMVFKKGQKAWNKGIPHEIETRKKISQGRKGKLVGKNNPSWKGDNIKYQMIHIWLRKNFPKKNVCNFCNKRKNTDYALKKRKIHLRRRNHHFELCRKCHQCYDKIGFRKGIPSWMSGRKQSKEHIEKRFAKRRQNAS